MGKALPRVASASSGAGVSSGVSGSRAILDIFVPGSKGGSARGSKDLPLTPAQLIRLQRKGRKLVTGSVASGSVASRLDLLGYGGMASRTPSGQAL